MINIPAVHTVFHKDALFNTIAELYDIGTPLSSRFVSNGLNDTYAVETDRASFVLRIYKYGWRTESDIRFELDLLLHLHGGGIPLSIPIERRDGEWLTKLEAPEGLRYAVMFTFAEGKGKVDVEASRQYGRSVALLHRAADDFVTEHDRFTLDMHHLLDEPLQHILPFVQHRPDDHEFIKEAAFQLKKRLHELSESQLDWGVCHGDLHGGNVFYSEGEGLTHFDFDCCARGWRSYELSVFWWGRVDSRTKTEDFKDEYWDAFLESYLMERPLKDLDLEAIPLFVAARQIWLMGLHTGNSSVWGAWQDDRYFDRKLKFLRAWMEVHRL